MMEFRTPMIFRDYMEDANESVEGRFTWTDFVDLGPSDKRQAEEAISDTFRKLKMLGAPKSRYVNIKSFKWVRKGSYIHLYFTVVPKMSDDDVVDDFNRDADKFFYDAVGKALGDGFYDAFPDFGTKGSKIDIY